MSVPGAAKAEAVPFEPIWLAREILRAEGAALLKLADRIAPDSLARAVELIQACSGRLVVSGIGKAGLVARKISATFSSTGTPSQFLHSAEAAHGDLGCFRSGDVALVLSYSGATEEIVRLLPPLAELRIPLIAVTGRRASPLGHAASVVLDLGQLDEACELGLAPSTTTTAMVALGDALALVVSRLRAFTARDFARFHPGGSLGRRLTRVEEVMRRLEDCRLGHTGQSVREAITATSRPGRRTGAIMVRDQAGRLAGIFTDSDLAKLIAQTRDDVLDRPIEDVMTGDPKVIRSGESLEGAIEVLDRHKISELPVVDACGFPIGLIDVTDILAIAGGRKPPAEPVRLAAGLRVFDRDANP
ncbi:MAG: KpsF/GutQ family sugar-phosphate isomerase [Planctomycetes bacterium]|nr:KpsF/GutQ family sugar-phosphate isomerase [Planctomycetota bacterium]